MVDILILSRFQVLLDIGIKSQKEISFFGLVQDIQKQFTLASVFAFDLFNKITFTLLIGAGFSVLSALGWFT